MTEFLPVSSSGHLALGQRQLGLDPDSPTLLLFDLMAHLGTLIAVWIVFATPTRRYVHRLIRESLPSWHGRRRVAWRITLLGIAATVPTAAIGLGFKDTLEAAFDKPRWIGIGLLVTGVLLALTAMIRRGRRGWRQFRWWQAVLVGLAQGLAILPGISRSGSTICVAAYCGLRRRWAAEFSFLIVVPAILGATVLKTKEAFELPALQSSAIPWGPIAVGSVVSLIVGVFALRLLVQAVRRAKLHYFAVYCWIVGVITLLTSG